MRRAAILGLTLLAAPALAQGAVPPADLAGLAMQVCIRDNPDASEGLRVPGFSVQARLGRTVVYADEDGTTIRLTPSPGFFVCEMRVPDTDPAYLDALLADLGPAIRKRFATTDGESTGNGSTWALTAATDAVVTIDVARDEAGVVSIVSSADAAPLTVPTQ